MLTITIRLSNNAIDVSPDGHSPLPDSLKPILESQLRYTYVKLLRGQDAYDFSGQRKPIQTEVRLLYTYDRYGRLVCGIGFLLRIKQLLAQQGYQTKIEDCNPAHPRVNRFNEDWVNVLRNFEFKAKQDKLLLEISSHDRGIIDAPTGFGKTFSFAAICLLYPKANIVIACKRKDIVQSTRIGLSKYLPNIGQVGGGINKPSRITVATANSLHRIDASNTDILLIDEVHEFATPQYSASLAKFLYARMFGFSGSPTGRMDNADIKLESLFGPTIFRMRYQEAVELGLVVPIHVRWIDINLETNPAEGLEDVPRTRWGIWRNEGRNRIIANTANEFSDDEQVLIMVTTFDHAVHLRQFLPDFTLCYAERTDDTAFNKFVKNGLLPADEPLMTSARRQELRQQFESGKLKKVIATDVWSTGVSFNQLSVLIRADARSSEIMDTQIPGRVCRLHTDTNKTFGLLIDCLDQFDSRFREAARKRRRHYESKGWIQDLPTIGRLARR